MKRDQLISKLQDPAFINEILEELVLPNSKLDLISHPRLKLPLSATKEPKGSGNLKAESNELFKRDTFLTGSSVASIILQKLYGIKPKYNDIDLFFYNHKSFTQETIPLEQYENLTDTARHLYCIAKSIEFQNFNFIKIKITNNFEWTNLLESFDLNCSKVGIVLETKDIFFTDSFIKFLETRVVTIDCKPSSNNFITSFIRAQKKSKDHESKFYIGDHFKEHIHNHLSEFFSSDMALDREVLQNISNSDSKKDKEIVSKKRWQQLLAEPELLLPYVSVIDEKRIKINFPNEPWVDFLRENFAKLGLSCFDLCYDFNEIKSKTSSFFNKLTILMYSNLEKNKGNWLKLIKNDQAVKLKADFSIKMLDHLQDFLKNHDSFSEGLALSFIVNLNFSIQETLDFFRFCKNLPRETLGEIESRIPQLLRELSGKANANDDDSLVVFLRLKDYKGMLKFLDENKFKRISKDFLIKPLLLPFTKNISEITTESGLMAEGSTMKHCVGGFGNKVKRSECRIFHIESKGSLSTLEIEIHEAKIIFPKKKECKIKKGCTVDQAVKSKRSKFRTIKVFVIRQHRSKYNGRPSSVNLKIAEKLVMYLNQTIQYYPAIKATGDIVSKKDLIAKN